MIYCLDSSLKTNNPYESRTINSAVQINKIKSSFLIPMLSPVETLPKKILPSSTISPSASIWLSNAFFVFDPKTDTPPVQPYLDISHALFL